MVSVVVIVLDLGRRLINSVEESVYSAIERGLGHLRNATFAEQERGELGRVSRLEEQNRFLWSSL